MIVTILFSCNTTKKEKQEPINSEIESLHQIQANIDMDSTKMYIKKGVQPARNPFLNSSQIVLVVVENENAVEGQLRLLENQTDKWTFKNEPIAINIGKNGSAWGTSELDETLTLGIQKKEGDGKAPAGIFNLISTYGYAEESEANFIKMPYQKVTSKDLCVDDVNDVLYNQIIDASNLEKTWTSAEKMLRNDDLYKWGIVVDYNQNPVQKGKGSCIFIHLWRDKGKGTHGCTAMSEANMMNLLHWLDSSKHPKMILITKSLYKYLENWFELPSL